MFQHRGYGLIQAYQIGATFMLTVLFWVYYAALGHMITDFALGSVPNYVEYYIALMLGFQVATLRARQQDFFAITSGIIEANRFVMPQVLMVLAITSVFLVLTKDVVISRLFLCTYLPMAYVALVLFSRFAMERVPGFFLGGAIDNLLLIGDPAKLQRIESFLSRCGILGFQVGGIITDDDVSGLPANIPYLGGSKDLEPILATGKYNKILLLGIPMNREELRKFIHLTDSHGCRLSAVNDLDDLFGCRISNFKSGGIDLIELRQEPLENLVNRMLKRILDIALSLPVVIFVLPVIALLVLVLHRLQAPGSLLFEQERSGIQNQHFTIYKFRTMYAGRPDSGRQAKESDERIFPAGRWMRRFSLDEFPQFYNVLRGDMSLVGPRPHMPQHDRIFAEIMNRYPLRGAVQPGITGLAQVRGYRGEAKSEEVIIQRVESDLEYIETWSLSLDVRILWRTCVHLIRPPKSAY